MKKLSVVSMMLFLILGFAGCGAKKVDTGNLKEVATHVVGDVAIVLLNSAGELKQGQNQFVVQFRDPKGQRIGSAPARVRRRCSGEIGRAHV